METRRQAIHIFPSLEAGGSQLRTRELIDGSPSDPHRFDHLVVALDGGRTRDEGASWIPETCAVTTLPKAGSVSTVWRLRHLLRAHSPALVLTYDWGAIDGVLANATSVRAPLIHHEDGVGDDEQDRIKLRRAWARRVILKSANLVVVPSRVLAQRAAQSWHVLEDRIRHIPNGVDTARFHPPGYDRRAEFRSQYGVPAGAHLIGTVGRLAPIKNQTLLVEALARIPPTPTRTSADVHVVIAGTGEQEHALRRRADELGVGDRSHLLGHVPRPETLLNALDVFALTSKSEQHPLAILEAMASGLPIVATDVGDIRLMLPETQHRFLVPAESRGGDAASQTAAEIATRLLEVLDSEAARFEMGKGNRDRAVERFSRDAMVTAHHAAHREALQGYECDHVPA